MPVQKRTYRLIFNGKYIDSDVPVNLFSSKKELSIVIPTYNEAENIKEVVSRVKEVIQKTSFHSSYEIIIIDDNSKDNSYDILFSLSKIEKDFIGVNRLKKGIATAVLDGISIANGNFVLTMDADLSHPPEKIPEMLKYIKDYDIIIGSRYAKGGGMDASFARKWGGFFLNRICSFIIGTEVRDLGGNFRLFKKSSFEKIKFKYPCTFAEFGHEIFYRAKKLGLKKKEVPFTYHNRKKGKSKMGELPIKQAVHYIKRAFQLRFEPFLKSN